MNGYFYENRDRNNEITRQNVSDERGKATNRIIPKGSQKQYKIHKNNYFEGCHLPVRLLDFLLKKCNAGSNIDPSKTSVQFALLFE
ncbi:hypothetical protein CEXT_518471 [Caerostris extrusa]|uniref:Uncharacterized protein n=1 Tax=Caerostris extrusa TaxID=172846 RepID=A0AAV4TW65_CAEEX|nr:hypothetical protein CEXT_518471 [Caerostris extrusa]